MKKYFLIIGIILSLLVISCSQQPEQAASQPKIIISGPEETAPSAKTSPEEGIIPVESAKEEPPAKTDAPNKVEETLPAAENIREFSITAKQFEFIPSTIAVNKGDKVKLSINSADVTHGFSISEYGINENINPGKTTIVEFTADKAGEFTFFCSIYCGTGHKSMKGKLIVQ